ncbi:MAG: hypothetical protein GY926_24600 [bacterium]|nr:hypothetical protein [bacterium]
MDALESPSLSFVALPRWLRQIPPVVQDTVLAVILTGTLLADLVRQELGPDGPFRSADALGYLLVALLMLPLMVRRRYPLSVFAVILFDATIVATLFYRPTSFGFGLIVATYTVARWCTPRVSVVALLLAEVFGLYIKLRVTAAGLDVGWFSWPLDAVYFGAAWFLGYSIRSQRAYATALEQSREALAQRAVHDERARIARELHDAVGHSVSVMLLHSGAAEEQIETNPARARQALDSVGDVGRATLAEMDHLLGLLRTDDSETSPILRPSLINLDTLIQEFRDLGLPVETTIAGEAAPLPTAVDQSAFRIIQESLTNTLKHAGPTEAEVSITFSDRDLAVDIRDHGRADRQHQALPDSHHSRGIIGMRERATMLGGHLDASPCSDAGFLVSVRLPYTSGHRS